MMNLRNYFKIVFADERISDEKLAKFTEIHIQRLAANNSDGRYTKMIETTNAAYEAYFGAMTDEDTKFAVQQSYTKAMNEVYEEFKKTISQKEGTVRGIWNTDSPTYQEFFPLGVMDYTRCTLANVEMLMARFINASRAHEKELGEAFINQFTDIQTRFISARTAQLQKKGQVSESKDISGKRRIELEKQLTRNLLSLAVEYLGDEDRGMDFFDQSFIRKAVSEKEEEETKPE